MRVYVLTAPLEPAAYASPSPSAVQSEAPTHLGVRRVLVPDYLDTTDILLRDGRNEIKVDTTGRWGERLSKGLTQALAADLAVRLPRDSVVLDASGIAPRQLLINVEAMDVWPDGHCVIAADWSIVDRRAKSAAATGLTATIESVETTGSGTFATPAVTGGTDVGDANLVDAVVITVAKLADAIASNSQH
jgi:uncharacterized lipoprotein YmbA